MKIDEAKAECQRWLDYLDRQKEKSIALQKIAQERRKGTLSLPEAKHRIRALDRGLVVYDGARLAEAVKLLIQDAR